nr:restriction endonuclease subunit S [uncultured Flavobacterium sp.]
MASRGDINITEVQPILRNEWLKIKIDETIEKSGTFTKLKSKDFFNQGKYPVVDQGDKFISGYVNEESLLYQGELPVIIFGDHTRNVKFVDFPFAAGADGTKILKPKAFYNPKFYHYYFKSLNVPNLGYSRHFSILKELEFPLPPLPEQHRIVAKLDTFFSKLETIKTSMANIPLLLKDFRQQVLTQAVTGKLTEEWRKGKEMESSEKLVHNIIEKRIIDFDLKCKTAKEKGERKPTKVLLTKLPEIDPIDIELPENWFQTNVHFLSFVTKLAGFEYSLHFDLKDNGEVPVVRAQNVQMGRFEDKNRLFMSEETSDFLVRSQLHGREILMVFIGAGTGNVCLAPKNERWHLAPNVAKIDVDGISTEYLYLYLQSSLGIENVLSRVKATAQPSLSMETIREIIALVPPLLEQQEIVRRVESLFAKADAIEQQYKTLKACIDNVPQAILHKAFKGELSEQLESDGDARELLQQIQQLKEATTKAGKNIKSKTQISKAKKVKNYPENEEVLRMVAEHQ